MPAIGSVRMPRNNKVSIDKSLNTSDIWTKTIGHDPHAPEADDDPKANTKLQEQNEINSSAKGLFELARMTGGTTATPGACRKCGHTGHLAFQCRNTMTLLPETTAGSSKPSAFQAVEEKMR